MTATAKLFGTDGVRDLAGAGPLSPDGLVAFGRSVARALRVVRPRIAALRALVGRDPRPSGAAIEADLARGLALEGARIDSAGVVPTPAVSYLVRRGRYDIGIVISASHNPPAYNGVKVFEEDGTKSSDALEEEIERAYAALRAGEDAPSGAGGPPRSVPALAREYVAALVALDPERSIAGRRVVLDCANGSTGAAARETFAALGVEATVLFGDMDGARINDGAGALHPEVAAKTVRETGAFAGFSFDGDGDRVIAVDERGATHDGDDILCALGPFLRARGELPGDTVVATILSNMGLEVALREAGIRLERTPVGDRHVSRRLLEGGFALGGEQSGHVVLARSVGPTGDGIACAVEVLRAAAALGRPLSSLLSGFSRYPQVAKNVRVARKPALEGLAPVQDAIARAERALSGRGRIVVRYSGTEPLARVMVEAADAALTESAAGEVALALEREIGEAANGAGA
jgi:phosphoglucosamine mutase